MTRRQTEAMIRSFDILFVLLSIQLLLPALVIICFLIFVTMGFPVFFVQKRLGTNGTLFNIIKFRTMLNSTLPDTGEYEKVNENPNAVKVKNDPRITTLGSFFRKTGIDEIPQLFNILVGHMSFVGPRPFIEEECVEFPPKWLRRLETKPGITGLAQINGRDNLSMEELVKYDLEWNKVYSLKWYFLILFKTIPYIFKADGI